MHQRQLPEPDRRRVLRGAGLAAAGAAASLFLDLPAKAAGLTHTMSTKVGKPDIVHGPRTTPNIALTFHGQGDPAIVQKLLAIFKNTNTPISVFAIGNWLKGYPEVAKQMLDAGYDLGNHTMNHYQMKTLKASVVDSEIAQCAAELKKLTGSHGKWFRPSGTQYSTTLIRNAAAKYGYAQCISYDVDSHDYQDVGKTKVLADVAKDLKNGSIVSLHFGHQDTIDAMPTLLENIHIKGFTPVTLTTLLGA